MNVYYLVEKFSAQSNYSGGEVIALNPEAGLHLENNRIPYKAINEFYSERELNKNADSYFFEQIGWFKQFDAFLKDNISYCRANNINLATAHYNPLKYLVDSCVANSFILNSFFKKADPSKVIFVTDDSDQDYSLYKIFRPRKSFHAQLLPFFCRKYNTQLDYITSVGPSSGSYGSEKKGLKDRLKDISLRLGLKSLQSFIKYKKYVLFNQRKREIYSVGILFLHTGDYQIDFVVRRVLEEGARVYTMSKDFIFHEGRYTQDVALDFSKPAAESFITAVRKECAQAALKLKEHSSILEWINDKCQIDVAALVAPYFEGFINQTCAEDIVNINRLSDFYAKENIDFIVVRSSSGRDSAFSLAAANNHKIKKVCLQHGSTAYEQVSTLMTDVYFFDYYLATDSISQKYLDIRANNRLFNHCKIFQSPHYFNSLRGSHLKSYPCFKNKKETIIYAPGHTPAGVYNFNIPTYEPNWYCKFLKELVGYLSQRKDKLFIFKYCVGNNWVERAVVSYIRAKNFANIRLENNPLITYLDMADRVIVDYPSTGFFESIAAGVPALSLYSRDHELWDYARDFFGPMLRPFADAKEAIVHIDDFLVSDREKYMTKLPLEQSDIVDLFRYIRTPGS